MTATCWAVRETRVREQSRLDGWWSDSALTCILRKYRDHINRQGKSYLRLLTSTLLRDIKKKPFITHILFITYIFMCDKNAFDHSYLTENDGLVHTYIRRYACKLFLFSSTFEGLADNRVNSSLMWFESPNGFSLRNFVYIGNRGWRDNGAYSLILARGEKW